MSSCIECGKWVSHPSPSVIVVLSAMINQLKAKVPTDCTNDTFHSRSWMWGQLSFFGQQHALLHLWYLNSFILLFSLSCGIRATSSGVINYLKIHRLLYSWFTDIYSRTCSYRLKEMLSLFSMHLIWPVLPTEIAAIPFGSLVFRILPKLKQ